MATLTDKVTKARRSKYLEIVYFLWEEGIDVAHETYPSVSRDEWQGISDYFDTLRCEDCYCGSCVGLGDLSRGLDDQPEPLEPLANLVKDIEQ